MTTGATGPQISNSKAALDALLADAAEFGKQQSLGKDAQIKLYMKVFDASFHASIDLTVSKHGSDVDDAQLITAAYVKAQNVNAIFDAKAPNQRKAASCVRACIKGGQWTKGGKGEPLATANKLINIRQKLKQNADNAKKLDDAGNTFLKFCRTLVKRDQLPDDAELEAMCFKKAANLQTNADIIEAIRKQAMALREGKCAHNTVMDNSAEVDAIIENCTARLTAIAMENAAELQDDAA